MRRGGKVEVGGFHLFFGDPFSGMIVFRLFEGVYVVMKSARWSVVQIVAVMDLCSYEIVHNCKAAVGNWL